LARLAVATGKVCSNLGTNTNTVADLDVLHLGSDLDGLSNDLVADTERERNLAPSSGDGVNVGTADTAG